MTRAVVNGRRSPLREGIDTLGGGFGRMLGLLLLAFSLMFSYAVARPACESLFLANHGNRGLPWVWLTVALCVIVTVVIYNFLVAKVPVLWLFAGAAAASGALLVVLLLLYAVHVGFSSFALYVWKEIYVVVLVEIFWSMANILFSARVARWTYGLFCAAGSAGAVSGNLLVGVLAQWVGTANALWLVLALLVGIGVGTVTLGQRIPLPQPVGASNPARLWTAMSVLRRNRYLLLMVALVALTQIVITLVDYEFNGVVLSTFPDLDRRTQVIGWIYAAIDFGSLFLQLLTGVILRAVGLTGTLLGIPLLLAGSVALYLAAPAFLSMATAKVTSKVFDYSIFRAAKEILYIPLTYREKTEGKAIADVLTYRVAKGGASLILLAAGTWAAGLSLLWLTLMFLLGWVGVARALTRRYQMKTGVVPASGPSPTPSPGPASPPAASP